MAVLVQLALLVALALLATPSLAHANGSWWSWWNEIPGSVQTVGSAAAIGGIVALWKIAKDKSALVRRVADEVRAHEGTKSEKREAGPAPPTHVHVHVHTEK